MEPQIVVFTGTVGAGKSTQIRLLASKLRAKGLKVRTTFLKTGHIFAFLLEVILFRMLIRERKNVYPLRALIEEKQYFFKKLFKLWLIFDIVSVLIHFMFRIYIPLKMRHIVVVEEYIPATIADYVYLAKVLNLPLRNISSAIYLMLRLLHLSGFMQTIFLDADENVLRSRWSRRGSLDEKPDYLQMQRTLLLSFSEKFSSTFLYINTSSKTINETHRLIIEHLIQNFK